VYINRTLLFVLAIAVIFIPTAQEWITSDGTAWYRPYLLWAAVIALAWWNQRSSYGDDL
jgi:hypothetical protein